MNNAEDHMYVRSLRLLTLCIDLSASCCPNGTHIKTPLSRLDVSKFILSETHS